MIFISFIILVSLVIRLINVGTLPAALFGDVIQHLIKAKDLNFSWFGGDGPLFTIITAFSTRLLGFKFLTLKLTTIFISLLGIIFTYLYAKKLTNKSSLSYFASIFMSLSFWNISLSHQGKPYILVPLFTVLVSYFLLQKKYFWLGIILGISTYSQASAWGLLPLAFVSPSTLIGTLITGSLFFKNIFFASSSLIEKQSYLGEKMNIGEFNLSNLSNGISIVFINLFKQIKALFSAGDSCFRSNIPSSPHLDIITAIFFSVGVVIAIISALSYIKKYKFKQFIKKYFYPIFITFIIPFFLIQLPAALDINNPSSVPSHGRTLGMTPYVFIVASYGLFHFYQLFKKKIALPILVFVLVAIINLYNYWYLYPQTLPNNNVPFAEIISKKASTIDPNIPVFIFGTGWGDWGQPESNGFNFLPNNGFPLDPPLTQENLCDSLYPYNTAIIFTSPNSNELETSLKTSNCNYWQIRPITTLEKSNQKIATEYLLSIPLD